MKSIIQSCKRASILIFIFIIIDIVKTVYSQLSLQSEIKLNHNNYLSMISAFIILGVISYNLRTGRRWARIVLIVIVGLWFPFIPQFLLQEFQYSFILGFFLITEIVLLVLVLALIINIEMEIWHKRKGK